MEELYGAVFLQGAERQTAEGLGLTAIVCVARAHARPCARGGWGGGGGGWGGVLGGVGVLAVEDAKSNYPQPLDTQDTAEVASWTSSPGG